MFNFFKTKKNYENVPAATFKQLITQNPEAVIIDVRTPAEFKGGAIKEAINIDIMGGAFHQKITQFDKDRTYFLYCRSGSRSASACTMMENEGFRNLYNLSGGIINY